MTSQSKDNIVNIFNQRIGKANNERSWFSLENINYRKMQVDAYRAIIKCGPVFYSPVGGFGVIIIHFHANGAITKINAEVKPLKAGIWFAIGFAMLFSAVFLLIVPGTDKFLFLAFTWFIALGPVYLTILIWRYRLTKYLKSVLIDIGVHENMVREQ